MIKMQDVEEVKDLGQFFFIPTRHLEHLGKIFHVPQRRVWIWGFSPPSMTIDDSCYEMGDLSNEVKAILPVIPATFKHAQNQKRRTKEFHGMALTGKSID